MPPPPERNSRSRRLSSRDPDLSPLANKVESYESAGPREQIRAQRDSFGSQPRSRSDVLINRRKLTSRFSPSLVFIVLLLELSYLSCSCYCTVLCWHTLKLFCFYVLSNHAPLSLQTLPHCAELYVSLHAQCTTPCGHDRTVHRARVYA